MITTFTVKKEQGISDKSVGAACFRTNVRTLKLDVVTSP